MKKKTSAVETTEIINHGAGYVSYVPMSEGLEETYNFISGIVETDMTARNAVMKSTALKEFQEKLLHDKIVDSVNIEEELKDFLNSQKSEETGGNYKRSITVFLKYCENEKVDYLRITRKNSEKYLQYLNEKYAPGSVRTMTMAVCSFYNYLMQHHDKLFYQNVFLKLKLPDNIPTRKKDVVNKNDIKVLRREFLKDGKDYFVCLLDIVSKHGIRVGTFQKMIVNNNGYWYSVSKGKPIEGIFTKEEVKQIRETKLLEKSLSTLKNIFKKYTIKLFEEGKISCSYSIHDLRHFVITKRVKDMKIDEFLKFSRGFHKNPSTTLSYYNN